jgi:ADP-ribose pyrophosphatase
MSSEAGWSTLSASYAYQAQTPDEISFRLDEVRFPSGRRGRYVFADYPYEVCFVLPMDEAGRVLLLKQFRYPIGEELIEIPAGSPEAGESLEDCARREAQEETGFRVQRVRHVLTYYPSPGSSNEKAHIFFGSGLSPATKDDSSNEVVEPFFVERNEAFRMLAEGRIRNGGAALALALLAAQAG